MDDAKRFRLLGKYRTPRFRYGRKVLCAVRGEVKIVGLTEAPIPWTHGAAVPGEVGRIVLSVERAARVINWRPKVSLEQGLRRTVGWFVAKRQGDRDP